MSVGIIACQQKKLFTFLENRKKMIDKKIYSET